MKEELIEIRKKTGMNRKEFAEYFNIPYRTVQDWESGTRLAKNLLTSGFSEMIELSNEVSMVEIDVRDEWIGKTLIKSVPL